MSNLPKVAQLILHRAKILTPAAWLQTCACHHRIWEELGSEARLSEFKYSLCRCGSWVSCLTCQLCFIIFKMGLMVVLTLEGHYDDYVSLLGDGRGRASGAQ